MLHGKIVVEGDDPERGYGLGGGCSGRERSESFVQVPDSRGNVNRPGNGPQHRLDRVLVNPFAMTRSS